MSLTSTQFNKLATKDEHKNLEVKVDKIDKKIDSLLTAVDGLAQKIGNYEAEQASNVVAHGRMQEMIDKLVVKVKKLEAKK